MNENLIMAVAWAAGLILGTFFFGGLWWTVRKGMASKRPASWLLGSMLLRIGVVLVGFYYVSDGHWQRLLMCLLGFVMARFLVTKLVAPPIAHGAPSAMEVHHAP